MLPVIKMILLSNFRLRGKFYLETNGARPFGRRVYGKTSAALSETLRNDNTTISAENAQNDTLVSVANAQTSAYNRQLQQLNLSENQANLSSNKVAT